MYLTYVMYYCRLKLYFFGGKEMYIPIEERSLFHTVVEKAPQNKRDNWVLILGLQESKEFTKLGCMEHVDFEAVAAMLAEPIEGVKARFACVSATGRPQVLKKESKEILQTIVEYLAKRICICRFTLKIEKE